MTSPARSPRDLGRSPVGSPGGSPDLLQLEFAPAGAASRPASPHKAQGAPGFQSLRVRITGWLHQPL